MRRREVLTLIAGAGLGRSKRAPSTRERSHGSATLRPARTTTPWCGRTSTPFFGVSGISAMLRARTWLSSIDLRTAISTGCPTSPLSWSGSRWPSSSAAPTPAAAAASKATATIPIVMINVGIPSGLVSIASLGRPGGNVTGSSFTIGTETFGKGLELLKEAVPNLHRVAVLSNPANPSHALVTPALKIAAQGLALQVQMLEARGPDEFDSAFATMTKERVEGLYVVADVQFVLHAARLADLAMKSRLPSMHQLRRLVEAGGLMSYGHSAADQWRGAATFVDKLLKGAKASDLPVEQPTKFELVLNVKTAHVLGLTIPPSSSPAPMR